MLLDSAIKEGGIYKPLKWKIEYLYTSFFFSTIEMTVLIGYQ
jgi:hypothetical protein